jgi:crotonobetainyl-CoA:carnitine CoA-transferase CaiB-like acyl-CoA transferase
MRDLEVLLVVSLEQAVAAPYASCKLADAGARVIKVERAEGDFARNHDNLVNGESAYSTSCGSIATRNPYVSTSRNRMIVSF